MPDPIGTAGYTDPGNVGSDPLGARRDVTRTENVTHSGTFTASGTNTLSGATTISGATVLSGATVASTPAAAQTLTGNGQTITLPTAGFTKEVTTASARTGTILTAGTVDGQMLLLFHSGSAANTITMAASGTSNVANGASCVIAGLEAALFIWDAGGSLWFSVSDAQ